MTSKAKEKKKVLLKRVAVQNLSQAEVYHKQQDARLHVSSLTCTTRQSVQQLLMNVLPL